jgi:hypothetical protein
MDCGNALWIDAVGLYYIAQGFNLDIDKLVKTIYEEIYPQKKIGVILDRNSTELCTTYNRLQA